MAFPNKKDKKEDRITHLPIDVMGRILSNLNVSDQVRTSILSPVWRNKWASAPNLYFDDKFYQRFRRDRYSYSVIHKTITDVLTLHDGAIHKFSLCIHKDMDFGIRTEHLNTWIPFMSREVKHLEFVTHSKEKDQMPEVLFSCKELTYLKFSSFNLSIPPSLCIFTKLLELHLVSIKVKSNELESLMSACPCLEKLSIDRCIGDLVISSSSLKVFVMRLIDTQSVCLKNANNLNDLTLTILDGRCFINRLTQIMRLSVFGWQKYDYIIDSMLQANSLSSLEYLKLDCLKLKEKRELLYTVSVLKRVPSLVKLDIQSIQKSYRDDDTTQMTDLPKELECCCPKLQTVNICVGDYTLKNALSLVQFILANSPLLKTLTFTYCYQKKLDASMQFNISQDLLWMKRTSPGAHVKFLLSTYA